MPMWHCPHCGAPQPEAARCWVCRRSSTTCSTCRHFRRAVAGRIGFCGLDRTRLPLSGDEMRGCWEVAPDRPDDDATRPLAAAGSSPSAGRVARDFVPLEGPRRPGVRGAGAQAIDVSADRPSRSSAAVPDLGALTTDGGEAWRDRVSLFGDEV